MLLRFSYYTFFCVSISSCFASFFSVGLCVSWKFLYRLFDASRPSVKARHALNYLMISFLTLMFSTSVDFNNVNSQINGRSSTNFMKDGCDAHFDIVSLNNVVIYQRKHFKCVKQQPYNGLLFLQKTFPPESSYTNTNITNDKKHLFLLE